MDNSAFSAIPHDLIMIDLETLDTIATAQVLQIGAVNILKPHHNYIATVDRTSQQNYFTTTSADTIAWWQEQPGEVRQLVLFGNWNIKEALRRLARWFPKNALVFGYGSVMDIAILEYHYRANDLEIPWHYRNVRCFRTIYEHAKKEMPGLEKAIPVIAHNALDDAVAQAITFRQILEYKPSIAF